MRIVIDAILHVIENENTHEVIYKTKSPYKFKDAIDILLTEAQKFDHYGNEKILFSVPAEKIKRLQEWDNGNG